MTKSSVIARMQSVFWIIGLLALAGCNNPPAATPRPAATVAVAPPRRATVIVTVPPPPTETLIPTATLPYDISALEGIWQITLVYSLRDNPVIPTVRYTGSSGLTVTAGGDISGTIDFYAVAEGLQCAIQVTDALPTTASIKGKLRPANNQTSPTDVVADLTLTPVDPAAVTTFKVICPEFRNTFDMAQPIFWPALMATNNLTLSIPFRPGFHQSITNDLSGPTAGGLRGLLISEVLSLSR